MRSPCFGCDREHQDKNADECKFCDARAAYAKGAEYYKFIVRPSRMAGRSYSGEVRMKKEDPPGNAGPVTTETAAETKTCRHCKETKPLIAYYGHPHAKDGHETICKVCKAAQSRRRRKLKPEQKERREKEEKQPEQVTGLPVPRPGVLVLDFSRHPDLLEKLKIVAKDEFRTPESHVLYLLHANLKNPEFWDYAIVPWAMEEQGLEEG